MGKMRSVAEPYRPNGVKLQNDWCKTKEKVNRQEYRHYEKVEEKCRIRSLLRGDQ